MPIIPDCKSMPPQMTSKEIAHAKTEKKISLSKGQFHSFFFEVQEKLFENSKNMYFCNMITCSQIDPLSKNCRVVYTLAIKPHWFTVECTWI